MNGDLDDQLLSACLTEAETRLLNELPPENELHHTFSRRYRKKMRALCRQERRSLRVRNTAKRIPAAAASVAVLLLLFGGAVSTEAARLKILTSINTFADYTELKISAETEQLEFEALSPTYVPAGYKADEQILDKTSNVIIYKHTPTEKTIFYTQDLVTNNVYFFDTEASIVKNIWIGNQKVTLSEKKTESRCMLYWYDNQYLFWLSGQNMSQIEELQKMAESIINQS